MTYPANSGAGGQDCTVNDGDDTLEHRKGEFCTRSNEFQNVGCRWVHIVGKEMLLLFCSFKRYI